MVLLTGASGKSGGLLVRRLAAEAAAGNFTRPLRVVARPSSNMAALNESGLAIEAAVREEISLYLAAEKQRRR